jgi:hypothetical protein
MDLLARRRGHVRSNPNPLPVTTDTFIRSRAKLASPNVTVTS